MEPYFDCPQFTIYNGDCLEVLKYLPENHFHSVVTDPPYEINFMSKKWDAAGVSFEKETWAAVLRVMRPGAHMLAFGGTRTFHRIAFAIEDAGFAIRDTCMWVFGSGFPKNLDVSKALDKAVGAPREVIGKYQPPGMKGKWNLKKAKDKRNVEVFSSPRNNLDITEPSTEDAKLWDGWGTALKPAYEPITLARKPLEEDTVAKNVVKWGTGAINIDGSRVETNQIISNHGRSSEAAISKGVYNDSQFQVKEQTSGQKLGRFPANLIHDGSEEVISAFPDAPGQQGLAKTDGSNQNNKIFSPSKHVTYQPEPRGDTGSAARFFYQAKASQKDRDEGCEDLAKKALAYGNQAQAEVKRGNTEHSSEGGMNTVKMRYNTHPTVKPFNLMTYLCKLVTPPTGVILDPFMGSGSTGKAAVSLGFKFVGIEKSEEYCRIAVARIQNELNKKGSAEENTAKPKDETMEMFPDLF